MRLLFNNIFKLTEISSHITHRRGKYFLSLFLILTLSTLIIFSVISLRNALLRENSKKFSKDITQCNAVLPAERFSCYSYMLEKYYKDNLDGLLEEIKQPDVLSFTSTDNSYGVFGTNCHTFYHAIGDYIATHPVNEPFKTTIDRCPSSCTSACTMGLYKRVALQNKFSTEKLKEFYSSCRVNELHQCSHEIGHLLHDKYVYSILKIVDDISLKKYGMKPKEEYQYTTFKEVDFNAPFEECKQLVPEKELPYCYTGVGHNLFLFAEFSPGGYKSQFQECLGVEKNNQDNCLGFLIYRIGINEAAPRYLSNKISEGNAICENSVKDLRREDLVHHCYLGIGGGLGLFLDSEYSTINEKNTQSLIWDMYKYASFCKQATKGHEESCLMGLLGTKYKKIYDDLHLNIPEIEEVLPKIETGFQVVG